MLARHVLAPIGSERHVHFEKQLMTWVERLQSSSRTHGSSALIVNRQNKHGRKEKLIIFLLASSCFFLGGCCQTAPVTSGCTQSGDVLEGFCLLPLMPFVTELMELVRGEPTILGLSCPVMQVGLRKH